MAFSITLMGSRFSSELRSSSLPRGTHSCPSGPLASETGMLRGPGAHILPFPHRSPCSHGFIDLNKMLWTSYVQTSLTIPKANAPLKTTVIQVRHELESLKFTFNSSQLSEEARLHGVRLQPPFEGLVPVCPREGAVCVSSPEMLTPSPLEICLHVQAGRDGSIAGDELREPQRGIMVEILCWVPLGTASRCHWRGRAGRRAPGAAVHCGLRRLQRPCR